MSGGLILDCLAVGLRTLGGLFICGRAFPKSKITVKEILAVCAIAILAAVGITQADLEIDKMFAIHCMEVISIWGCRVYIGKADRRMVLFVNVFYTLAAHVVTYAIGSILTLATKDPVFLDHAVWKGKLSEVAAGLVILMLSVIIYLARKVNHKVMTRVGGGLVFVLLAYFISLTSQTLVEFNRDDVDVCMYYLLGLFFAIFGFQMSKQVEMEKELAEMKAAETQLLEREYHSLSQSYETNAKLFHDFRNHCGVLKNFLAKGKSEDALKYLEDLTGAGNTFEGKVWTGDETVDYLISSKESISKEKGIEFDAQVEFPRNINIKSSDLCAILGNLLDNAIEACAKVEETKERKIRLVIRRIQQMMVIKVENTYYETPVVKYGNFQTSKTDGGLHGFGIKSARTAAEKYDGMIQTNCTDKVFTTVVTLSFEGVKR